MKRAMFAATALMLLLSTPAWAQTTNFSGTWKVDVAKSDFGPAPPPESIVMVIDHKEPVIKATTTQKSQIGDTSNDSVITTDGKENTNRLKGAGLEQDVKSTTKWNGTKLATQRTMEVQGMSIGMTDSWELSADGKVLTVSRTISTPQGDFATRTVFNKQ